MLRFARNVRRKKPQSISNQLRRVLARWEDWRATRRKR
jgi:hypothetical protein